jgi:hypothetical protein
VDGDAPSPLPLEGDAPSSPSVGSQSFNAEQSK